MKRFSSIVVLLGVGLVAGLLISNYYNDNYLYAPEVDVRPEDEVLVLDDVEDFADLGDNSVEEVAEEPIAQQPVAAAENEGTADEVVVDSALFANLDQSGLAASVPGVTNTWEYWDWVTWFGAIVEPYWLDNWWVIAPDRSFVPLTGGIFAVTAGVDACNGQTLEFDSSGFYCRDGDWIGIDPDRYGRNYDAFGPSVLAYVIAHEYGHRIQYELELSTRGTDMWEVQADCFAGAFLGDLYYGNFNMLMANDADMQSLVEFFDLVVSKGGRYIDDGFWYGFNEGKEPCVGLFP